MIRFVVARPLLQARIAVMAAALALAGALGVAPSAPARATACDISTIRAGSRWRGRYTCGQGLTDLTLVIRAVRGSRVTALFDFDWRRGGIRGSFEMRGVLSPTTCRLQLLPARWIEQPSGWVMVALDGTLTKHSTIYSGRVDPNAPGAPCTTFSVSLVR